ncbi:MAG: zinc dependent phospholipase C family protein [Acidobacteriota bacterium]|nr:zinc dependent phospholipase C family protein [Acidobacteriota bacterium]
MALLSMAPGAQAYSVLTHEAIIDITWDQTIQPRLLARFPGTTPDQLVVAHGYAYGGAIIQDMGYYPFSSKLFSDLVHYSRTGDFVVNLLREAQDVNEYAFAMGALAHYAADNNGHPIAVNRVVPMLYPKDRAKFGDKVTYEDDPTAHIRTEFGFDVVEVAKGRYASKAYHDFIGFQVSKPVLERAFTDTYGVELKDIFKSLDLALGTYRRTVSTTIPEMSKAAWAAKKKDIQASQPGITRRQFMYNLSRSSYEKEWGHQYEKPGFGARFLAVVMRIVPKVGPFKALAFKVPTPEAEKLFMDSFDKSVVRFKELAAQMDGEAPRLANQNFDTGQPTRAGEYHMADDTYAKLLEKLADHKSPVPEDLRANILAFYSGQPLEASEKARQELMALRH